MKKFMAAIMGTVLVISTAGCGEKKAAQQMHVFEEQKIEGEIRVSCYDTIMYGQYVKEAAAAFEAKYPGTKIHVETFSAMPEIKTMETEDGNQVAVMARGNDDAQKQEYVNKMNTELMSGKGADLIATDIIPYYKYIESGQMEDLTYYMQNDPDFDTTAYQTNLWEALRVKEGQYVFPLDYNFSFGTYDTTLLDSFQVEKIKEKESFTVEELTKIGADNFKTPIEDGPVLYQYYGGYEFFRMVFGQKFSQFIDIKDKKVSLISPAFIELLHTIKEYEKKGYIHKDFIAEGKSTEAIIESMGKDQVYFRINDVFTLINLFQDQEEEVVFSTGGAVGENEEIAGLFTNEQNEIPFQYYQGYMMNTNSANKRLSWEFLKFLVDEQMQTSLSIFGVPMNNQARMEKARLYVSNQFFSTKESRDPVSLTEKQQRVYEAYMTQLEDFSRQLNRYIWKDSMVQEMVMKEVAYYFKGEKSAEEVAEILQNKVELYLNE